MTISFDDSRRAQTYAPDKSAQITAPAVATIERALARGLDPHAITTSQKDDTTLAEMVRGYVLGAKSAKGAKEVGSVTSPSSSPTARPSNKDVTYIGMNGGEGTEAAALARTTTVHVAPHDDSVKLEGRSYDLRSPAQCDAFAAALVKDPARATVLSNLLKGSAARSELAYFATMLARGENGSGPVPSRLVLSGHNFGEGPFGKRSLGFASVQGVAKVFPKGAALVETVHFSACSTGRELDVNRAQWQSAFPGLTSMMGYRRVVPAGRIWRG